MNDLADRIHTIAHDDFGHDRLLTGQEETIAALGNGEDVLLVAPTGAGKSLTYLVAGRLLDGPVVVVSPLLALEQDQVDAVTAAPTPVAAARLSSAESAAQRRAALEQAAAGEVGYLFCSPELLADDDVRSALADLRPVLVAVDEAHCVAAWGHDFRPDYQRLGAVVEDLGRPPVLATTATAAAPVRAEIAERLRMRSPRTVVTGFARPEIALDVRRCRDEAEQTEAVVGVVADHAKAGEAGLVYARTRPAVEELAERLAGELDVPVGAYHGGLSRTRREAVQESFMDGSTPVVVATSAFGMGVDKPDVRFVVHAQVPGSPDVYWQEAGRAGRDGEPATATLMYRPEDLGLGRYFSGGVPSATDLRRVLAACDTPPEEADAAALAEDLPFGRRKTGKLLNLLELGVARLDGEDDPTPSAIVDSAREVAEAQRALELSRVDMIRAYAETGRCRAEYLLAYFGEVGEACGHCDSCRSGSAAEHAHDDDSPYTVDETVTHPTFGEGTVTDVTDGEVTVLFDEAGYRTIDATLAEEKDLLTG
ncbi:ATP-dependent DNA helicase RecQ [Nocardioides sp. CFH 31398]|uniref:RecQ family ATP-dependent DNA helicase n=1 Tax=Nocardioides sp. CFH 31398 TaxID=2919579 RepID=UPI001F055295|nr:RecQ family ATP-dependent DNA helicase [Nocardioides sp. CFH 31398]MCH1865485.1 RecQ family ATP-dependent DNA helicase [Nocardioides sp. CFH 31398]